MAWLGFGCLGCSSGEGEAVFEGSSESGSSSGSAADDQVDPAQDDGSESTAGHGPGDTDGSSTTGGSSDGLDEGEGSSTSGEGSTGADGMVDPGFPVDCDAFQVWVEGGGGYSTVVDGVDATPPDGTVYICPGTYAESVDVLRNVTIIGAGQDLVTIEAGPDQDAFGDTVASALTDVTIRDLTIAGARYGITMAFDFADDQVSRVELRNLRVTGTSRSAIRLAGSVTGAYPLDSFQAELVDVTVDGAMSEHNGAGLYLQGFVTELTDCVIENNTTSADGGGLYLFGSVVSMVGGSVRSNTAAGRGGGVFIRRTESSLNVVDADWGTGQDDENEDEDVACLGNISEDLVSSSTWLGDPASALCGWNGEYEDCCVPN